MFVHLPLLGPPPLNKNVLATQTFYVCKHWFSEAMLQAFRWYKNRLHFIYDINPSIIQRIFIFVETAPISLKIFLQIWL